MKRTVMLCHLDTALRGLSALSVRRTRNTDTSKLEYVPAISKSDTYEHKRAKTNERQVSVRCHTSKVDITVYHHIHTYADDGEVEHRPEYGEIRFDTKRHQLQCHFCHE